MGSEKDKPRIFYGWWVVFAFALIELFFGATYTSGFTAFVNPIAAELGWTYGAISLSSTVRGFESGLLSPFIGVFADKLGPRILFFWGVIIAGFGFWFFSTIHSLWSFYASSLVTALGFSLAGHVVALTAVARWFKTKTTLAMGFVLTGLAAGGLLVPLVVWLVDRFGWRQALVGFAFGSWILGIPLALLVKNPNDASKQKGSGTSAPREELKGATTREVLRMRSFWLLSTAVFFAGVSGVALMVHQIPYLVSIGFTRQTAGVMASVFAISSITGRVLFGWLGDVFEKRWCFVAAALAEGVGVIVFVSARSLWQVIFALVPLGVGYGGTIPLRPALQVELFGRRAFGTVQGLLLVFMTLGSMIAPPFAGWMFDLVKSYRPAFLVLSVCAFMAIPTILLVRKETTANST
ncbi:MAG: MFS transporter [Chloroflexota bacterium]